MTTTSSGVAQSLRIESCCEDYVVGFPLNEPGKSPEWFNDHTGGIPGWFNKTSKAFRKGEHQEGDILCTEIAFCARFDDEELEFPSIRYFFEGEGDPFEEEGSVKKLSAYHVKQLGFFLLPSHRTWDRIMSFGSELFKKVVKFQEAIPGKTVVRLRDDLRSTEEGIEKEEPLSGIIERINHELEGFVGAEETGINFLPTGGDVESVLNSITPYLPGKGKANLPLGRHGSGVISLQTLLLLLEFGQHRQEQKENFIIVAEEPELHLHPTLHRRLVSRIRGLTTQSVVTTHSPEIASYYRPSEILILRNHSGNLTPFTLSERVPSANALMRLFTIHRSDLCEALMNKLVLVPEGLTEFYWFKKLLTSCITAEGWEFYENEISHSQVFGILPTQDAKVVTTFETFSPLVDDLVPVIDGDTAGNTYLVELKKLATPPKVVFQLPDEWFLEHVIAWILSPVDARDFEALSILLQTTVQDHAGLLGTLKCNKSNWIIHEAVMAYVVQTPNCFKRAHHFINSISIMEEPPGKTGCHWRRDQSKSSQKTAVYQLIVST